nr:hypothetical protein [Tanacetum cinerariifolium]
MEILYHCSGYHNPEAKRYRLRSHGTKTFGGDFLATRYRSIHYVHQWICIEPMEHQWLVPLGLNRLTMSELYCQSLDIVPSMNLFRIFYKVSKQGHWFSFEKRVGKGISGQIFCETFSGLKGWENIFFFVDRRAIPDAMVWRHHESDVNDPALEDGFSSLDVQALIEMVIDLRPVPSGLLFQGGLATT